MKLTRAEVEHAEWLGRSKEPHIATVLVERLAKALLEMDNAVWPIIQGAKTASGRSWLECPHGNVPVYPAHGWWCDECFVALETAQLVREEQHEAQQRDILPKWEPLATTPSSGKGTVLGQMREENEALRQRVAELEVSSSEQQKWTETIEFAPRPMQAAGVGKVVAPSEPFSEEQKRRVKAVAERLVAGGYVGPIEPSAEGQTTLGNLYGGASGYKGISTAGWKALEHVLKAASEPSAEETALDLIAIEMAAKVRLSQTDGIPYITMNAHDVLAMVAALRQAQQQLHSIGESFAAGEFVSRAESPKAGWINQLLAAGEFVGRASNT